MSRAVTQKDIADAAGLTVSSVSRALADHPMISDETKHRVRTIGEQLNYRPRRRRRGTQPARPSQMTFVVVDRSGALAYSDLLPVGTLGRAAAENGLDVDLKHAAVDDTQGSVEALVSALAGCQGVVLFGALDDDTLDAAAARGIQFVVLGGVEGDPGRPLTAGRIVCSDMLQMGYAATRRLIDLGHTRIGFVCRALPHGLWNERWRAGYKLAHAEAGLPIDAGYVLAPMAAPEAAARVAAMAARPTGYVFPYFGAAAAFVAEMRARSLDLSPRDLTMGGHYARARELHVETWPMAAEDIDAMIFTAVQQVRWTLAHGPLAPARVFVPHTLHNFG